VSPESFTVWFREEFEEVGFFAALAPPEDN
jgi:hypothetical protein